MDGVSIAASIIGIATAGAQVSIKLVTLATQISTASDRVSAIGNDVSLTSGVLRQLGDLMTENIKDRGISILNPDGLESTKTAAAMCERTFLEIEKEVKKASEQLRRYKPGLGKMRAQKIELSTTEKTKWPLLQPKIDGLRADLRDAKSTLILLLQVVTLALNKRMADASVSSSEYQDLIRAVVAIELDRREERANVTAQQGVSRSPSSDDVPGIGTPPTYDPETSISRTEFPGKRKGYPLDTTGDHLAINDIIDPPRSPPSSGTPNGPELKLFLLKPIVRDLFDRIELRWTVQDTYMRSRAIRDYMNKEEKDVVPSVVEMLQQLHAYEHEMVDAQMPKYSGSSIVSLRRKTIDIRSRDMLFKAVPGLEFVVQCHVDEPTSQLYGQAPQYLKNGLIYHDPRPMTPFGQSSSVPHSSMQRAYPSEIQASYTRPNLVTANRVEKKPHFNNNSRRKRRGRLQSAKKYAGFSSSMSESVDDMGEFEYGPSFELSPNGASLDEEAEFAPDAVPNGIPSAVPDEDAEAEAMVDDLLKQYTTLFDS